jgi:hypothetical protein
VVDLVAVVEAVVDSETVVDVVVDSVVAVFKPLRYNV